ncbi:ester cyclase [Longimicrobium sp.]|uniref:ester cyclase n=1 Tax=Longimicrobium sp. TaxID=2029185 RepID=UPI002E333485|nr:ester cyclase [Longimicrobium sp.]HEX6040440.1 ester cyclase [Longimicrobium sp.]
MPDDTLEQNKAIVRQMLEAFNTGNAEIVQKLLHPDLLDRSRAIGLEPGIRDAPAVRRVQTEVMREGEAFPDRRFEEVYIMAEGDRVMLRWAMTGTNTGTFLGRKPTGRAVKTAGTEFIRIRDGQIVEHDDDPLHILDLLWQMGLLDCADVLRTPEFAVPLAEQREQAGSTRSTADASGTGGDTGGRGPRTDPPRGRPDDNPGRGPGGGGAPGRGR